MTIGNLAALWQKEAKRLMGYSSIAHSGYLMIGVLVFSSWGITATLYHAVVYLVMNFLVFMMIELYNPIIKGTRIENYMGQFKNSPVYAALLSIGFISLIGIPPTGGFTSKFMLFSAAWNSFAVSGEQIMLWLVIAGVVNTLISLSYYLRIPYFMAFRDIRQSNSAGTLKRPVFISVGMILAVIIFILFMSPDRLVHILNNLTFAFQGMTQ